MSLSIDCKGWHIWQNTQGRIICNGPDLENRLLDFKTLDDAVNWLYMAGYREQSRALNATKAKAQPAGLWEAQKRR
jgi:hypothetical protein